MDYLIAALEVAQLVLIVLIFRRKVEVVETPTMHVTRITETIPKRKNAVESNNPYDPMR